MCGIYGIVFHGDPVAKLTRSTKLFMHLAVESADRGTDATGLARIDTDGYVSVYKNCLPSYEVVGFMRWWRPLWNTSPCTLAFMGHTRWGTHGDNTLENAHPFHFKDCVHGSLVGTHNGIIRNYARFGPKPLLPVDSANLFHGLATTKREDWPDLLNKVQGSMALAWSTPGMVHFARNIGSPCELVYIEELDATVYASTLTILHKALTDAGLPVLGRKPYTLPAGELWTFTPACATPVKLVYEEYTDWQPYQWPSHKHATERRNIVNAWSSSRSLLDVVSKDDVTDEMGMNQDDEVQCDRCGATVLWKEIIVPHHKTCFWCVDCAVVMNADDDEGTTEVADDSGWEEAVDPIVCLHCGKETVLNRMVQITTGQGAGDWACAECANVNVPPVTYLDRRSGLALMRDTELECDNCGSRYPAAEDGSSIYFMNSAQAYLCVECCQDPAIPFCAPSA